MVKVLVNPYANRWGAKRRIPQIHAACQEANLNYDLSLIPGAGQGARATREAVAAGYDVIVAAGGDGTVNEVVNGLMPANGDGPTLPLGVLPLGTGNDFSDINGVPRDLASAAHLIAAGLTRQLDLGMVTVDGSPHYFDNNCALAMEPLVTLENIRMKRLSGNVRYLAALVKALIKLQAWQMVIENEEHTIEGPTLLLSVCNGSRTGGIFPMAPSARTDDGQLDVVYAPQLPKVAVLALVVKLIRGTHIHDRRVRYLRASELSVRSTPGTPVHTDGELIAESAREINYKVLPGRLTLLAPAHAHAPAPAAAPAT
jgi:diacylglycerol kinase (ATP)